MGADTFLTSLGRIKEWLGVDTANTDADALLTRMNRTVSAFVLNHLNRDALSLTQYSDIYDGYGNSFMVLRRNPVYRVLAVSFNGQAIPAATGDGFANPYTNGWVLEPEYSIMGAQRLNFYGYVTPRHRSAVAVRYTSGYVTTEAATIPAAADYTVSTVFFWLSDISVAKASDGTLFTKVDANPGPGQYTVANGVYTFNAADASTAIVLTYSFVPSDIENAVIEIVAERYRYMDRIGMVSKSLGGQENVSFSQKAMSSFIGENLTPYINVTPI